MGASDCLSQYQPHHIQFHMNLKASSNWKIPPDLSFCTAWVQMNWLKIKFVLDEHQSIRRACALHVYLCTGEAGGASELLMVSALCRCLPSSRTEMFLHLFKCCFKSPAGRHRRGSWKPNRCFWQDHQSHVIYISFTSLFTFESFFFLFSKEI